MKLHPLEGHEKARAAVAAAFLRDRLPQALLLHGPPGVGKQRFGLWTAQLLLCAQPGRDGPCDSCQGCHLARRVEHPDLHWYFPVKKPPSRGSRERDDEALEDARVDLLEERRTRPLYPTHSDEPRGLHLGTVRNLRRRVASRPSMAPRQIFIIGRAEELVAQDSSPEAANALLKVLEEPPAGTWFLLTSDEPGRLLATVRSRTSSLYLPALPRERVEGVLCAAAGADADDAARAARLASGSMGRALGFLPDPDGDGDGPLESIRKDAFHLLRAALSARPQDRFARALSFRPVGARGLQELLVALEMWLRDLAAVAGGAPDHALNKDAVEWLSRKVRETELHPVHVARALESVEEARAQAAGNVNPQLLIAGLLLRLGRALIPHRARVGSA